MGRQLSAEELQAELADMLEHIPFLATQVENAESRWRAQKQASEAAYGRDQRWWPAGSVTNLQALAKAVESLRSALTEAKAYRAELQGRLEAQTWPETP